MENKNYVLQSQTFEVYGSQSLWGHSGGVAERTISVPVTEALGETSSISELETSLPLAPSMIRFVHRSAFISMILLISAVLIAF